MKTHVSVLTSRMIKAAMRVEIRYRVVAAGVDNRNRIIGIATNRPRLQSRSYHAEEILMSRSPRSLVRILLARVNNRGELMPIDPCEVCSRLAKKRNVTIERLLP